MEKDDILKSAFKLWNDFKNQIVFENRFIKEHEVLDNLIKLVPNRTTFLESGTTLYRARIFKGNPLYKLKILDDDTLNYYEKFNEMLNIKKAESGFYGYNESESFVPPNEAFIPEGRANPMYIKYLYTAQSPYTALVEVRPFLEDIISIAEIKCEAQLKIVDFSYDSLGNLETIQEILLYYIMSDFSKPTNSNPKDYIPTQYVAEFIKTLGYDGIKFNSSLHKQGRNITIFNFNECKAINSKLYNISDIGFIANPLFPSDENPLKHHRFLY